MLPKTEMRIKRHADLKKHMLKRERKQAISVLALHKKMLAYLNILTGDKLKEEAIMAMQKAKQKPKKKK
jgi:DNA-binding protein H-NS